VIPEVNYYEACAFRFDSACSASQVFLHGGKPSMTELAMQEALEGARSQAHRPGYAATHRGDLRGLSLAYFLLFINHPKTNIWGLDPHFRPQIAGNRQFDTLRLIKGVVDSFSVIRVESFDDDLGRISENMALRH